MGMDKEKITLSQVLIEIDITYEHVLHIEIDNKENQHGKMILWCNIRKW